MTLTFGIKEVEEGQIEGIINEGDVSNDSPTSEQMTHLSVSLLHRRDTTVFFLETNLSFHQL